MEKRRLFSKTILFLPMVGLGILALLMVWWNGAQAATLLAWAREREGRHHWLDLQYEAAGPLRELVDHPEILRDLLDRSPVVVAGGVRSQDRWLNGFSRNPQVSLDSLPIPEAESALAIGHDLVVARFHFRGGPRGGHMGEGPGKGRRLGPGPNREPRPQEEPEIGKESASQTHQPPGCGIESPAAPSPNPGMRALGGPFDIVLVFPDVDASLVFPMRVQQALWGAIWAIASGLWLFALRTHERNLVLHEIQRREAHVASVGRVTARLAHEIKNPLGAIRGTAQHLQKKLRDQPGVTDLLDMIESETIRLEDLARGILDYSRPPQFQPVPLDTVSAIRDCIQLVLQNNPGRKIAFQPGCEHLVITADAHAVRQVMLNVLQNALEADDTGTPIEIVLEEAAETVCIRVLDPGPGLSAEARERVFEPFFSTKTKGYGLGLVICRKILEGHQGTFVLKNRAKGGCCAELHFPRGGLS
jgi:signal transduction histidine kinase